MDPRNVIVRPVISEKSYALIAEGKYTFRVNDRSHKTQIAHAVEPSLSYRHQAPVPGDERAVGVAMSNAACDIAETLGAKAIVVPTFSGRTASAVARLRPRLPIIGLSHRQSSVQQLALEWGIYPTTMEHAESVDELIESALHGARDFAGLEPGAKVVITAGRAGMAGGTNLIMVREVPGA